MDTEDEDDIHMSDNNDHLSIDIYISRDLEIDTSIVLFVDGFIVWSIATHAPGLIRIPHIRIRMRLKDEGFFLVLFLFSWLNRQTRTRFGGNTLFHLFHTVSSMRGDNSFVYIRHGSVWSMYNSNYVVNDDILALVSLDLSI